MESIAEQLEQLTELLANGDISEKEYELLKQRVLGGLGEEVPASPLGTPKAASPPQRVKWLGLGAVAVLGIVVWLATSGSDNQEIPAATPVASTTTVVVPATSLPVEETSDMTPEEICVASLELGQASCAGIDLRGWVPQLLVAYENGDFSGAILDGVNFGSRSFAGSNFTNASLVGATVSHGADWSGTVLINADMTDWSIQRGEGTVT